jgi:hypothetical protein
VRVGLSYVVLLMLRCDVVVQVRPNAYIPEDIAIPKPYGGFGPFKPSDQGSTMRHTRKPQPREIVI